MFLSNSKRVPRILNLCLVRSNPVSANLIIYHIKLNLNNRFLFSIVLLFLVINPFFLAFDRLLHSHSFLNQSLIYTFPSISQNGSQDSFPCRFSSCWRCSCCCPGCSKLDLRGLHDILYVADSLCQIPQSCSTQCSKTVESAYLCQVSDESGFSRSDLTEDSIFWHDYQHLRLFL